MAVAPWNHDRILLTSEFSNSIRTRGDHEVSHHNHEATEQFHQSVQNLPMQLTPVLTSKAQCPTAGLLPATVRAVSHRLIFAWHAGSATVLQLPQR